MRVVGQFGKDRGQCEAYGAFFAHPEADCILQEYPSKLETIYVLGLELVGLVDVRKPFRGGTRKASSIRSSPKPSAR